MSTRYTNEETSALFSLAARLAIAERRNLGEIEPVALPSLSQSRFNVDLPDAPRDPIDVLRHLDRAARSGISGTTRAGFMGWVIGGSHPAGVAADWLAASWGQNACLYDTSPAASEAEAASAGWLLDLLDLPRDASVGFTTGATMASFTALAAARLAVLERAGHDFERDGLYGCPPVSIFISEDAHVSNFAVLRYLGFGENQIVRVRCNADGVFDLAALEESLLDSRAEARIVVAQAGHIMSGAFDDFDAVSRLCRERSAWLHVDGAFGLWVRASVKARSLSANVDLADSWSVDGHKWLQLPYDCGFAIVRNEQYHRRAMAMQAGYLSAPTAHRNNSDYVPELSRRARGFAAWSVMQAMGRSGIAAMIERHCSAARVLADLLDTVPGIEVINRVYLNQLAVRVSEGSSNASSWLAERLKRDGQFFVRTATWRGEDILRISIINFSTTLNDAKVLQSNIARLMKERREWAA